MNKNEVAKTELNIDNALKMEITPAVVSFPGEKELTDFLNAEMEKYRSLVITDDSMKDAKTAKTTLNKMKTALNNARIQKEKEMMKPFNEFKTTIADLIKKIDETIQPIDEKIKEADEMERQAKKEKIKVELMEIIKGHEISEEEAGFFEFDPKWLNKTTTMKAIRESLVEQARMYLKAKEEQAQAHKVIHNMADTLNVTEENYIKLYDDGMDLDGVLEFMKAEKANIERLRKEEEQRRIAEEQAKEEPKQEEPQTDPEFDYLAGVNVDEIDPHNHSNYDIETGEVIGGDIPTFETDESDSVVLKLSGSIDDLERLNDVMVSLNIQAELIDLENDYIKII